MESVGTPIGENVRKINWWAKYYDAAKDVLSRYLEKGEWDQMTEEEIALLKIACSLVGIDFLHAKDYARATLIKCASTKGCIDPSLEWEGGCDECPFSEEVKKTTVDKEKVDELIKELQSRIDYLYMLKQSVCLLSGAEIEDYVLNTANGKYYRIFNLETYHPHLPVNALELDKLLRGELKARIYRPSCSPVFKYELISKTELDEAVKELEAFIKAHKKSQ